MSDIAEARWHFIQLQEKRREQEQLAGVIAERLAPLLAAPRRSPWVLVSEEVPVYPVDVLMTIEERPGVRWTRVGRFVPALKGDPRGDYVWWVDGKDATNVIAWMPFPQPLQDF